MTRRTSPDAMPWPCSAELLASLAGCGRSRANTVIVGSKNFTEQIILGELLAQQIEAHTMLRADRRLDLGGTLICHQAMLAGQMDLYAEYTGTALTAILRQPASHDAAQSTDAFATPIAIAFGFDVGPPLGFNNTSRSWSAARTPGVCTCARSPTWCRSLRTGAPDSATNSWSAPTAIRGLAKAYGLNFARRSRSIMDLGLLYRALKEKQVDVVAGNSTDGLIAALGMVVLEDDRHYFPPYQAVTVVRAATFERHPELRDALDALGGKISDDDMRQMNYAVDGDQRDPAAVARDFRRMRSL